MIRALLVTLGVLFFLTPPAQATAWARCSETGYLYHFDPRLAARSCELITSEEIHWRGGSVTLNVIKPDDMPAIAEIAQFRTRIHQAAVEIGQAMDRMGGTLRLDNVTLLATNFVSPREAATDRDPGFDKAAYEAAARTLFDHECPVSFYKSERPMADGGEFAFVLAHEVFHCIQYKTWPAMTDEDWLTEGSAEYFAYLAHPNFGAGHIAGFDAAIPDRPLNTLDYSAVAFYLWMGDASGPARVREFISSTRSIQAAVTPDMWIEFAQRYFDHTIHMPDGAVMPSTPRLGGVVNINSDQHITYPPVIPFTLNNSVVAFARDKAYTLTREPTPPDFRELWRQEAGGDWHEMPNSVTTCSGEQRFRVIWATTRSNHTGAINVRAQPASASTCTCPAGTWRETPDSIRRYMQQSISSSGGPEFISGSRVLQLNPDHTGSLTYEGVITETHASAEFWTRQTKTGGTHFTWSARNGRLLTILSHGDNLLNLYNEIHTPRGVTIENRRSGAQSIGHAFFCDDAGLHLRQVAPSPNPFGAAFSVDMDFVRIGGAPPPTPGH